MTAQTASDDFRRRVQRAYELGRLKASAWSALLLATAAALLGSQLIGVGALAWAPLTFAIWLWLGWRGGALLHGARYGLFAGALTCALPLSLLRPCCRLDASGVATCTMPEMCVALGALAGLPLSAWLLSRRATRHFELGAGLWLGAISVATFKCSALFLGEAFGLLGGVALGMLAASALGMVTARARHS